jgi:hypothetical protein
MSNDIVERLRAYRVATDPSHPLHPKICDEAADEIERLRRWVLAAGTRKQIVVPMPLDAEGRGPEMDPGKRVRTVWQVWNAADYSTVKEFETEREARDYLEALGNE